MRMSWTYFSFDWTDSASLAECFFLIRENADPTQLVTLEGTFPDGRQFFLVAWKNGKVQLFPDVASASVHLTKQALGVQAAGCLTGLDFSEWVEDPNEPDGISIEEVCRDIHRTEDLYPSASASCKWLPNFRQA